MDLETLNYFNLFEIFFMPPPEGPDPTEEPRKPKKKKYNMIESVVKEED